MRPVVPGFFSGIGLQETLLILVVALILFGHRLPEVARSFGKGYREFRRSLGALQSQIEAEDADAEVAPARPRAAEAAPAKAPEGPGSREAGPVPPQEEKERQP
ncbi:MAG: twin-arginine translocase TatA/TatE family subunit [Planctomycetes bacterium]|jgi:TatA/E family protein of Tat protein translocase|nr:twin-arginine translocase TatA/TatE family subunit [Planctomycetota bacterium]